ncbi:MAG: hypothetical protein HY875_16570 [Chloroflexi bacterium]|nr:hypothetical protein [Chloroflexota bacterium]
MKVKTSVTLSEDLLRAIARVSGDESRSEFIEDATWAEIRRRQCDERDQRDIAIINANAAELNAEALEVLEFQAALAPAGDE